MIIKEQIIKDFENGLICIEDVVDFVRTDAIEDFEMKMTYFCFGLKASQGNLCRVDVFEDELIRVKRQLKEYK